MKKRIVVIFLLGSFLFVRQVSAKAFNEKLIFQEYSIKTYRANPVISTARHIFYFTDSEKNVYYFLNPTANFFQGNAYPANISNVEEEILKEISRVIYYGYGYKNQNSLEYYAATQYLLFNAYKEYTITFIDEERNQVNLFQEEIAQIEKNLEKSEFQLEDFQTTKTTFEIEEEYIVKHFEVKGENIQAEEKDNKIEITLLNDKEEYTLEFIPKADCTNVEVFGRNNDTQFIHMDLVCENTYTRKVYVEKEEIPSQNQMEDKENTIHKLKNEVGTSKKKETIVSVPATGKNSSIWILLLFLLGDAYYVFKK